MHFVFVFSQFQVLLVNKRFTPANVTLNGASGQIIRVVDEATGDGPPRQETLASNTFRLDPFAVALLRLEN
eukprot:m.184251 g.184251  ORF g.184251 m.184251 type:complete len:71 (-) comp16665_c1_seq3:2397-2609(-)